MLLLLPAHPQVKDGDKLDRKALMQEALSERLKEAQVRRCAGWCWAAEEQQVMNT